MAVTFGKIRTTQPTDQPTSEGAPMRAARLVKGIGTLAAVATLAVSAGCGGEDPSSEAPAKQPPTTSTTLSPTEAPIEAFAQVVAQHRGDWARTVADAEANCASMDTASDCRGDYMLLRSTGSVIHLALTGLHADEAAPAYVGDAPAEINSLLSETEQAALAVRDTVEAMLDEPACDSPVAAECESYLFAVDGAVAALSEKLGGWDAYL